MAYITGIQQVGVGVKEGKEAWAWYKKYLGMDIKVFESSDPAAFMLPYTEGKPREKYAALALNMEGGGGFEIWQHTGFEPRPANFEIELGDTGILITKLKSRSIEKAYHFHKEENVNLCSEIKRTPWGVKHYFLKDPYNNLFEIVESDLSFMNQKSVNGGVVGCVIGVSDIEKSLPFYRDVLEYDLLEFDEETHFDDLSDLRGGERSLRRVLLRHSETKNGSFSPLYGPTEIELIESNDGLKRDPFEGRMWGELGFIHLCFDAQGMDELKQICAEKGSPFTVDSSEKLEGETFEMGSAGGRFAYVEDPDGTLIEFVEVHKVPIKEKWGWYMPVKRGKPLPRWMLKTLSWGRV